MNTDAIIVSKVKKSFQLPHERVTGLKQRLIHFRSRQIASYQVLHGIDFSVKEGEFFGIVGRNGSGKSTLLKLLAGVYTPDSGSVIVRGTLTPFIELGVGFNPELTGRENVFLNGALLGFDRQQMSLMYDEIVEFAELENFMDQKLKNYSSGMQVRLAFSVSIKVKSNILLIDEVLAVGDAAFQRKCYDHFMYLKKIKQTVVLVTHDMEAVRQYCDRAIMVEDGNVLYEGTPDTIAQAYQELFSNEIAQKSSASTNFIDDADRWGSGKMRILEAKVTSTREQLYIETTFQAQQLLEAPIYGFTIFNSAGQNLLESNTKRLKFKTKSLDSLEKVSFRWIVPNICPSGTYSLSVACCDQSATEYYDWLNSATYFSSEKQESTAGLADPLIGIEKFN